MQEIQAATVLEAQAAEVAQQAIQAPLETLAITAAVGQAEQEVMAGQAVTVAVAAEPVQILYF